jgi:uncharacterized protein involved in type VI secretion and phage assembly
MPCVPYGGDQNQGFLCIPEPGAGVWVEFEEGDLEFPIWVGTFWSKPGGNNELPKPNNADGSEQASVQSPPTRKIIKTRKGHTIQLEDKDQEEMIIIIQKIDEGKHNIITMDKEGIKITDAQGSSIEMQENAFNILAKVPFKIDASGQSILIIGDTIDLNKG